MRTFVSRLCFLLAILCLAFTMISLIVLTVKDGPCCRPSTPFTDAVMLVMLASIPLLILGIIVAPPAATGCMAALEAERSLTHRSFGEKQ